MLGALSRRLAGAQDKLDQSNHEVGTRVADYLLGLEGDYSAGGIRIELPLPKKDIASLLGTTPESLSRALAKLVEQDVIELNGPRGPGYRRMIETCAVGRAGTPDEVGNVAALLMGPDGAFITGSDILMDGGVTAAYRFGELAPQ